MYYVITGIGTYDCAVRPFPELEEALRAYSDYQNGTAVLAKRILSLEQIALRQFIEAVKEIHSEDDCTIEQRKDCQICAAISFSRHLINDDSD